jgi:hypothetical protein
LGQAPQLELFSDQELTDLISRLEDGLTRVTIPVISACVDVIITAAVSLLYQRLEAAGDHDAALAVLASYGERHVL